MTTYTPPTGRQLRRLLARWELTGASAGALVSVNPRTIRRWTSGDYPIPFGALYCLAHRSEGATIEPGEWRRELGFEDA